jgi:hypothetical protein
MPSNRLPSIEHIVVLMLENRSFDHMLGLLYASEHNISPAGQHFEGLTGSETNPGVDGAAVPVFTRSERWQRLFHAGCGSGRRIRGDQRTCLATRLLPHRPSPPTKDSSRTSTTPWDGRRKKDGQFFPGRRPTPSWASIRRACCPYYRDWRVDLRFATTGSLQFPRRRCPTGLSSMRGPRKDSWMTKRKSTPAPAYSA